MSVGNGRAARHVVRSWLLDIHKPGTESTENGRLNRPTDKDVLTGSGGSTECPDMAVRDGAAVSEPCSDVI